jgi:hypothetical protein
MKRSTYLITILVLAAKTMFAQPYTLPFQEMYNGTTSLSTYTSSALNLITTTKNWELTESIIRSPEVTPGIAFKTFSEGGYLLSPEINITSGTALEVNFMARMVLNDIGADAAAKKTNNLLRNIYVILGNDTIYDHHKFYEDGTTPLFQNPIRFMAGYIYEGSSPVKLKFIGKNTYQGVWTSNQDGLIIMSRSAVTNNTGTLVRATDTVPALNISYGHNINMGTINLNTNPAGTTVNKSFSFKGVNMVGDVVLSDANATNISLPVKTYVPVSGSVNETVALNITVPANPGTYTEKLTVVADADRANNTTNTMIRSTRSIWVRYSVTDTSTDIDALTTKTQITTTNGLIRIQSPTATDVEVFSTSGVLIKNLKNVANATFNLPKGLYMVKTGSQITKITL